MVSFVSQSLRDAPGCGGVSAMFPTLAALALLAVFATTTLTAFSAEAAVSSDDIAESVPLSADLESGESEEEFSSDIDVPDFYTGADGDVFALAEDVFGSPDLEADPADAVGDLEPFIGPVAHGYPAANQVRHRIDALRRQPGDGAVVGE